MAQYYFDIETTGFNPKEDKIVTIQYQELDDFGKIKGDLTILKEWELGEDEILKRIYKLLCLNDWGFIPIGTNLIFDLTFLFERFRIHKIECEDLSTFLYHKPQIDIKSSLVIANSLNFKGSGLNHMTNKETDGRNIPIWYKSKEYDKIESYIKQETESFLEFFEKLKTKLIELKPIEEVDDSLPCDKNLK